MKYTYMHEFWMKGIFTFYKQNKIVCKCEPKEKKRTFPTQLNFTFERFLFRLPKELAQCLYLSTLFEPLNVKEFFFFQKNFILRPHE